MALTNESKELLGKIMAQLLSILALSTKAMTDRKFSELVQSMCIFLADYGSEKFLKKLVGRKDVEDAVSRLDMLTKEESLMVMARNLEVTHRIDGVVHDVDSNVKATKVLTEDIGDSVKATRVLTEDIDGDVKATKVLVEDIDRNVKVIQGVARNVDSRTQHILSVFSCILTHYHIST